MARSERSEPRTTRRNPASIFEEPASSSDHPFRQRGEAWELRLSEDRREHFPVSGQYYLAHPIVARLALPAHGAWGRAVAGRLRQASNLDRWLGGEPHDPFLRRAAWAISSGGQEAEAACHVGR